MSEANKRESASCRCKPCGLCPLVKVGLVVGVIVVVAILILGRDRKPPAEAPSDEGGPVATGSSSDSEPSEGPPGLVGAEWVAERLGQPGLKVIDCRGEAEYAAGHIPGSLRLAASDFRGEVGGVASMLLPGDFLAGKLSLLGIEPGDTVVLVPDANVANAAAVGIGLDRVGHRRWAILNGGFAAWTHEDGRPVDDKVPEVSASDYPAPKAPDRFTVDSQTVLARVDDGKTVLLDTRPANAFVGGGPGFGRTGHIPGAVNRPIDEDMADGRLQPVAELAEAYRELIPSKDTPVVVYCRTGRQASQTYFVLKHLLGYDDVLWYDGSWTEWAARPDLPVATGS